MTAAYCVTISVLCLLRYPVPYQVGGTPRALHLCVGCVTLCSRLFCFVIFCFVLSFGGEVHPPSLPSLGTWTRVVIAHPLDTETLGGFLFLYLRVSALFLSLLLPSGCSYRVDFRLVDYLDIP